MKKIIIGVVLILGALATFFILTNSDKGPKFKTESIIKGDIVETVTASGTVNPVISTSVGTQTSGVIKSIYVDFNSPVRKGQLLAQIDPAIVETQVEQSRANLYNAQANLQKAQSIMVNDQKTYNRNKSLYEKNFIAKSDVDLAESNYKANKALVASSQAQISQANAALKINQTLLKYTKIVSPVNGIVVSRNIEVGQTVAASFQTPTLFLVAQDLTKMQIDTNVAESDIGKVKVGQEVEYTLDGYSDTTFKGKVKQIRIAPITIQNVVTYDVVINADNKDFKLKPGMTANVSIITDKKKNMLLVPNSSLRFTPINDDDAPKFKEQGIWILNGKKPKRIAVKTGISDGENTEIISNKVKEGQKVIVGTIEKSKGHKKGGGAPNMRML
ncbi:MAG: efflux RND transporter periplasmic adaptor subunit [bacterium]